MSLSATIRSFYYTSSGKLILFTLVLWILAMTWRYTINDRPLNLITWDVYGYYVYLPAAFIYHDIPSFSFVGSHRENYEISTNLYQLQKMDVDKWVPIYTMGLAWLWLPFFSVAHLLALIGPWAADGLSPPYQFAILIATLFYGGVGLVFLRKVLLLYANDTVAFWSLSAVGLGTNYFHYVTMDCGMPHAPLFTLYAVLLWLIIRYHRAPSLKWLIWLGGVSVLICLVRPSELILVLLFALYGIGQPIYLRSKWQFLQRPKWIISTLGIVLCFLLPQILIWKLATGQWIYNGYSGHHFDFLDPHLMEGLFSYRKGWLVYTPVMMLALAGMFFLRKKYSPWRWAIPTFVLVNMYIVLSWHIWWYASSFGMRALVQSYAILALPMAAILGQVFSLKRIHPILLKVVLLLAILLNLFQTWQYEQGILAKDEMNRLFYWNAFGKTNADRSRYRLIDLKELYPDRETAKLSPARSWSAQDRNASGEVCLFGEKKYSPAVDLGVDSTAWYRVEATVINRGDDFDKFKVARLVCSHIRGGKTVKWAGLRYPMYTAEGQWTTINLDIHMEQVKTGDILRVFLWNTSPDTACIRAIDIYRYLD